MARVGPLLVPGRSKYVAGAVLQGPPEGDEFGQRCGDAVAERLDQLPDQFAPARTIGFAVGGDHCQPLSSEEWSNATLALAASNQPATLAASPRRKQQG